MAKADPAPYLGQRVKVSHGKTSTTGVLIYQAVTAPTGKDPDAIVVREDNGVARVISAGSIKAIEQAFDDDRPGAGPVAP